MAPPKGPPPVSLTPWEVRHCRYFANAALLTPGRPPPPPNCPPVGRYWRHFSKAARVFGLANAPPPPPLGGGAVGVCPVVVPLPARRRKKPPLGSVTPSAFRQAVNFALATRRKPPVVEVPVGADAAVVAGVAEVALLVPPQPAASTASTASTGKQRSVGGHRLTEDSERWKAKKRVTTA